MPEEIQEGLVADTVEQPDADREEKIDAEIQSLLEEGLGLEPPADEQPADAPQEVSEPAPDANSPEQGLTEAEKGFQRTLTKKTQEFSEERKTLREELDAIKAQNAQLQALAQIPAVRREMEKAYGVKPAETQDVSEIESRLDPDSLKMLDQLVDARILKRLQPHTEYLQQIESERQMTAKERAQAKDDRDIESLKSGGYPVETHMDAVEKYRKDHSGLSFRDAFKIVYFEEAEKQGAKRQMDTITKKANTVVHRPGYNSSVSEPVLPEGSTADDVLASILQQELRK